MYTELEYMLHWNTRKQASLLGGIQAWVLQKLRENPNMSPLKVYNLQPVLKTILHAENFLTTQLGKKETLNGTIPFQKFRSYVNNINCA